MSIKLMNIDCLEYMRTLDDNAFDIAIVDPPYGLGDKIFKGGKSRIKLKSPKILDWDIVPDDFYFEELMRVSKNQIIWGGNYFDLPPCRGFVVWDKLQPLPNFSACEYAWTSFDTVARMFRYKNYGASHEEIKIHSCQKPVALYSWLLKNYCEPGHRILDTHLGSGSSAIAAHRHDLDFVGCEIDEEYFSAASERLENEKKQMTIF